MPSRIVYRCNGFVGMRPMPSGVLCQYNGFVCMHPVPSGVLFHGSRPDFLFRLLGRNLRIPAGSNHLSDMHADMQSGILERLRWRGPGPVPVVRQRSGVPVLLRDQRHLRDMPCGCGGGRNIQTLFKPVLARIPVHCRCQIQAHGRVYWVEHRWTIHFLVHV